MNDHHHRSHWLPDTPRPTTAARYPQNTYSNEYEDHELEESEDEDIFAYLPPSTADQQQYQQQQQQLHHQQQLDHVAASSPTFSDSNPHAPHRNRGPPTPVTPVSAAPTLTARTATTASSRDLDFQSPSHGTHFRSSEEHPKSFPLSEQSLTTPSMLEEDSRTGSIKCVRLPFGLLGLSTSDASSLPEWNSISMV
jgi:hypothetical protein